MLTPKKRNIYYLMVINLNSIKIIFAKIRKFLEFVILNGYKYSDFIRYIKYIKSKKSLNM